MKVTAVGNSDMSDKEVQAYVDRAIDMYGADNVKELVIESDGEYVNLTYHINNPVPFQRLRRITGYLVGTLDRWNDSKRAEERDRVKHTV